jgi:hypothetical protein
MTTSPTARYALPGTARIKNWLREHHCGGASSQDGVRTERVRSSTEGTQKSANRRHRWWRVRLFRGMVGDVRRRLPYYWSDWWDAWDYRVVPATVYMYFAKYGI